MRPAFLLPLALVVATPLAFAQDKTARYGIGLDTKTYPQSSPKETLSSVLKAIENKKIDYLLAHLAEPQFIDNRVKKIYGGKFSEQVDETRGRLDPFTVKQLKLFLDEGKFATEKAVATVTLEKVKNRQVKFIQKDGRWYLDNAWGK